MRLTSAALLPPLALLCSFASGFSISPKPFLSPSTSGPGSDMPNRVSGHDDQVNLLGRQQQQQHRQPQQNFARATPAALFASGGAQVDASAAGDGDSIDMTTGKFLASFWGTGGFVYILLRSIRKIVPIAMEPFGDGAVPLNRVQLA